jgi:hypothetical protein
MRFIEELSKLSVSLYNKFLLQLDRGNFFFFFFHFFGAFLRTIKKDYLHIFNGFCEIKKCEAQQKYRQKSKTRKMFCKK